MKIAWSHEMERRHVALNLMLNAHVEGETALVTCGGTIAHGITARRFRACVGRSLRRHRRVVLDLDAVTLIDARGVGMLAVLIARAKSEDRQLILARSSARVERVLRLTRLDEELHGDSAGQRTDRPAEPEDSRVLQHEVVRSHIGPVGARLVGKARAYEGRADRAADRGRRPKLRSCGSTNRARHVERITHQ